jgi:hypothetical protein
MGLLDNALQAIKNQYQETKGNVGLLMSDPKQYMSGLNQDAAEYNRLSSLALQAERNAYRGIPVSQEQAAAKQYIDQQQQDMALGFVGNIKPTGMPKNENFNKWFGESKVLTEGNDPLKMYHGTGKDFEAFQENRRGVHFLTPSPKFANKYAGEEYSVAVGESPNVIPAYVKSVNPFDFENKSHVNTIAIKAGLTPNAIKEVKQGLWSRIEDRTIMDAIKKSGFDGVYVKEEGVKNLGVFAPEQIKSTFNRGTFDPKDPRILYGGGLVGSTQLEMPEKKRKK